MNNFYPWNVEALSNWLQQELKFYQTVEKLSEALKIDAKTIRIWLTSCNRDFAVPITYDQIVAIGQFRSWPLEKVVKWLNLQPHHWQELLRNQK